MFQWLRELQDIRYEFKKRKLELSIEGKSKDLELVIPENDVVCESCETLKQQLGIANQEKKQLLDLIINRATPEEIMGNQFENLKPILPNKNGMNWNDRRRMLEENDRDKAKKIRAAVERESSRAMDSATNSNTIEELEEEIKNGTDGAKA